MMLIRRLDFQYLRGFHNKIVAATMNDLEIHCSMVASCAPASHGQVVQAPPGIGEARPGPLWNPTYTCRCVLIVPYFLNFPTRAIGSITGKPLCWQAMCAAEVAESASIISATQSLD